MKYDTKKPTRNKPMKQQKQNKDNLHILQPKNKKYHQLIQTHKCGSILQEHQHPTTHKAKNRQQYTRTGQERNQ
jgi:hypothetical protein